MPKILHIIESLGIGGAEILLRDTVKMLSEYKHVVCFLNNPDTLSTDISEYASVINLECSDNLSLIKAVFKLKNIIKIEKPSIIHAHLLKPTWIARLAAPHKIPFFFTVHNPLSKDAFSINKLSLIIEKLTYKKRHYLLSVSQESLDDYEQYVGIKGNSKVLYNFINDRYLQHSHINRLSLDNRLKMVSIGTLKPQKNHESLVEVMKRFKDKNISLDIYGSGDLSKKLEQVVKQENLNVTLKGNIADPVTILGNYDVYILASKYEGFGIAPLEAMGYGLPLLLSDLKVFREIVGSRAKYFDPNDLNSIESSILDVYSHWDAILKISQGNKEHVSTHFSSAVYHQQLLNLYKTAAI